MLVFALPGVAAVEALAVAEELRAAGVPAIAEMTPRSPGAGLKRAGKLGCRFAVLIGEEELASGRLPLKDLRQREQYEVGRDGLAALWKEKL